jgi:hypothetical protein
MGRPLDLTGIPEPIARAIEQLVKAIRHEMVVSPIRAKTPIELPVWELGVIEPWTRSDLYEEHLDRKFPPRDEDSPRIEEPS